MERVRKISKEYYLRQIVVCWLVFWMGFGLPAQIAMATPLNPDVVAGAAGVGQSGNTTTVNMGSARAVINWDSLDTSSAEILQFIKAGGSFAVLNRVIRGGATHFNGSLFGNQGHIIIVNTRGIIFGPTALIQAYKFTASALDIRNTDFMNGIYNFAGGGIGEVANYGRISAEQVALIGKRVLNAGTISAPDGFVIMAAGDKVFIGNEGGDIVVEVAGVTVPQEPPMEGMGDVINEGTIDAAGGTIVLAAGDTFSRAIEGLEGLTVAVESGTGRVGQFGTLNADGVDGDGGSITLTAGEVVALGEESLTTANAGLNGDGGDVIVYSPDTALFRDGAVIEAKGGSVSGDGGFVELSGMEHVELFGWVDASATDGAAGLYLIDPTDIFIVNEYGDTPWFPLTNPGGNPLLFQTNAAGNEIEAGVITGLLEDGTSVTLNTSHPTGGHSGPLGGDIYQYSNAQINKNTGGGDVTLTMLADDDITLNGGIVSNDAGSFTVKLDAGGDVTINSVISLYSTSSSDVVATVDIDADGDVYVYDDIKATAIGDGIEDAYATVTIDADGDVQVLGDGVVKAEAYDGVLNEADVEITGENVTVRGEGFFDDALVQAFAHDGGQNIANVTITANGEESGDVTVEASGILDGAIVKAEAKNELDEDDLSDGVIEGLTNTATVDISATGNVEVLAYGIFDEALVQAEAWNAIDIDPAPLPEPDDGEVVVLDLAIQGLTNTATVDITAGQNVNIAGTGSGDAAVEALAHNKMRVDIDNFKEDDAPEAIVNIAIADLQNTAGVTISADGEGGVLVAADGLSSKVGIAAKAYNEVEVEHKGYRRHGDHPVAAATVNLTVEGLLNNANIGITASNGSVEVGTGEFLFGSETVIEAAAYNIFEADFDKSTTANADFDGIANNAGIDITAGYGIEVIASDGGEAGIAASAWNELDADDDAESTITADNITNDAGVVIDAVEGSVIVKAECEGDCSDAYIIAEAWLDVPDFDFENIPENIKNDASVDITAGGDVTVKAKDCGDARIAAETWLGIDNTSNVTITTVGGNVFVHAIKGKHSKWSGFTPSSAKIEAIAEDADSSNTANVKIKATATTSEYPEGEETFVEVDGGNVKVKAVKGGEAEIKAFAADAKDCEEPDKVDGLPVDGPSNTANVEIRTTAVELVGVEKVCKDEFVKVADGDSFIVGGNVEVYAKKWGSGPPSKAKIQAVTLEGFSNTSGVLICAEGEVVVEGVKKGEALIKAIAHFGHINKADVGICGDEGLSVLASHGGYASIASKALFGYDNDAFTNVCTYGGVLVNGEMNGDAEILAEAKKGVENDATVAVCAVDDILVASGFNPKNILEGEGIGKIGSGGSATIKAEAEAKWQEQQIEVGPDPEDYEIIRSFANADATVVSHDGGVAVIDIACGQGGTAKIEAEAHNAWYNTAYTGVAAGGNLLDGILTEECEFYDDFYELTGGLGLGVVVVALGSDSRAGISSDAYDGYENTADTVICTPDIVGVLGLGDNSKAEIKSRAGRRYDDHELVNNKATTRVYAGDVGVYVDEGKGRGIRAHAAGLGHDESPRVFEYCMTEDGEIATTVALDGDSATLIIQDFGKAVDCPDCPPCPCEEEEGVAAAAAPAAEPVPSAAPLPLVQFLMIHGCPVEMAAAAAELGITMGNIQVAMGNALALNPSLQPCEACASLLNAAAILRDADGSRMAAMVQAFNALAPADAPFTPEMAASIATAFDDAAEGSQYALVMEYVDAFAQYVAVLDIELGSPVGDGDSVAFVMEKYGAGIEGSDNPNIAAFLAAQLGGL